MCGAGPISIREAARRVRRDVKAVHGDITALLNAGLVDRTAEGRVEFAFDAVKVEFMLNAAPIAGVAQPVKAVKVAAGDHR
jgi:predicted transcriptional regulator